MSKSYGVRFTTRPVLGQPGNSWEPPSADPHARWCGGRGLKTPGYPISLFYFGIYTTEKTEVTEMATSRHC